MSKAPCRTEVANHGVVQYGGFCAVFPTLSPAVRAPSLLWWGDPLQRTPEARGCPEETRWMLLSLGRARSRVIGA